MTREEGKTTVIHWGEINGPSHIVSIVIVYGTLEGGEPFKMMSAKQKSTKNEDKAKGGMKGWRGTKVVNFRQSSQFITGWSETRQGQTKGLSVVSQLRQCYTGVSSLTHGQWITRLSAGTMAGQLSPAPGRTCLLLRSWTREVTNL